jgi:hypothetical protein
MCTIISAKKSCTRDQVSQSLGEVNGSGAYGSVLRNIIKQARNTCSLSSLSISQGPVLFRDALIKQQNGGCLSHMHGKRSVLPKTINPADPSATYLTDRTDYQGAAVRLNLSSARRGLGDYRHLQGPSINACRGMPIVDRMPNANSLETPNFGCPWRSHQRIVAS